MATTHSPRLPRQPPDGTMAARPIASIEGARDESTAGLAPPSPAGPASSEETAQLPAPPTISLARPLQMLRFSQRQIEFVFRARRELGEVFYMRGAVPGGPLIISHPDHVRSLFTAGTEQAPSLSGESSLRPIIGPTQCSRLAVRATYASASSCCRVSTATRSRATSR